MIFSVFTSISTTVLKSCINNMLCKTTLKTSKDINAFNSISYIVCILAFGIILLSESLSYFTVLIALLFGLVTALHSMYNMLALSTGPMNITTLVTTSSMIIPTMSGIFFGEKFSILKLLVVFVLIGFIYLSLGKKSGVQGNGKWLLYSGLTFVLQGAIGVIQKIHQSSVYKDETGGFLFIAFICSFLFVIIKNRGSFGVKKLGGKNIIYAIICGACVFAPNFINLKLSGVLPSQLFFPLINGSCIILNSLASVIIFKERLSKKQCVGLIGGIVSLIAICLVP